MTPRMRACVRMHAVARMTDRPMRLKCARTLWCDGCAPEGTARHGCVYSGVATTAVRSFVSKTQTWIKVVRADIHRLEQAMRPSIRAACCTAVQQVATQCSKLQHSAASCNTVQHAGSGNMALALHYASLRCMRHSLPCPLVPPCSFACDLSRRWTSPTAPATACCDRSARRARRSARRCSSRPCFGLLSSSSRSSHSP